MLLFEPRMSWCQVGPWFETVKFVPTPQRGLPSPREPECLVDMPQLMASICWLCPIEWVVILQAGFVILSNNCTQ